MSAGVGIGAGLVSGLSAAHAEGAGAADIWSQEYWASKGGTKLNLWRKRVGAPKSGEKPRPVLFMVHGSSFSTRVSYDMQIPGNVEYSAMNLFARAGYDVWTMDHDGYGYSELSGNNSDIASGVADLKAAIPVVVKESGQQKMHFYGPSSGSIRAGAYAMVEPERVDRLVLAAFTYKGKDSVEMDRRRKRIDELRAKPRRKRDADMIRSVLHPRWPRRGLRSRADRSNRRGRDEAWRLDPKRHLSRHGRQSAAGRSDQGARRRC